MSLLSKIISTIRSGHPQHETAESAPTVNIENCLAAEDAVPDSPVVEQQEDENPTRQRRYYVKTGRYVDNEEEVAASRCASAEAVIFDRPPVDLKSLFPKLSLR